MVKRISADHIKLKRVYEKASPEDGTRVLVDRLWPRGLRKEAAAINHWFKEIAPSTELRKWFGHDPARWDEFRRRYVAELRKHAEQLGESGNSLDAARSRLCMPRMMNCIMTPLSFVTF
jgi:uncharacterized protein YeaO (DUF488 family)